MGADQGTESSTKGVIRALELLRRTCKRENFAGMGGRSGFRAAVPGPGGATGAMRVKLLRGKSCKTGFGPLTPLWISTTA